MDRGIGEFKYSSGKKTEEKRATVEEAVGRIQKKFGEGSTGLMIGKASDIKAKERIPTGILSLDRVMLGGFPRGMWSTIYGDPMTSKSTLALMIIAQAQKLGLVPVYIDAEGRFDSTWATQIGVDTDNLYILRPLETSAERVLETYVGLAKDRAVDLLILDSVSAIPPQEELDKSLEESSMTLMARLLSRFFRDYTGLNNAANICSIIIAQTRASMDKYAKKIDTLSCGRAILFYSKFIIGTGRKLPQADNIVERENGFVVTVDMSKTTGPGEGTRLEYEFINGHGIDTDLDMISTAIGEGIIVKGGGGMYTIPNSISGEDLPEPMKLRGYASFMEYMKADPGRIGRIREVCGQDIIGLSPSTV